jgi:hypothetical protein
MKMELNFVPPGGGETDYTMDVDLPSVPQPGDYITVRDLDPDAMPSGGTRDFIVRRTWWHIQIRTGDDAIGRAAAIVLECEFARGLHSSEDHKRSCDIYEERHKLHGRYQPIKTFEATCY